LVRVQNDERDAVVRGKSRVRGRPRVRGSVSRPHLLEVAGEPEGSTGLEEVFST
jgi:hypothetical protein